MTESQEILPETATLVTGTDLIVWHDGRTKSWARVLSDGAVELADGPTWIVRNAVD